MTNNSIINIKSLQSLSIHTHAIEAQVIERNLIKIAKTIGLKVKIHKYQFNNYENIPLPAMAESYEGDYFVVAPNWGDGFLIFDPELENQEIIDSSAKIKKKRNRIYLFSR